MTNPTTPTGPDFAGVLLGRCPNLTPHEPHDWRPFPGPFVSPPVPKRHCFGNWHALAAQAQP